MMDSTVRARVDSDLKQEAEAIFKKLGLSTSQVIVMFLNMVKQSCLINTMKNI